jgi:pyruvate dehydrogenase E1 component alpha subunit
VIEAQTYRHYGHSRSDPDKNRPDGELDQWLQRDPLVIARQHLHDVGLDDDAVARADDEAARTVAAAIEEAKAAPEPDPAEALTDVWADGGATWRT